MVYTYKYHMFRSLYVDKALSASVRLQLASTLCSFLTTAVESADDLKLSIRKRKRSGNHGENI